MAIEKVDLPIKKVIFHSFLYVYQRVQLWLYIRLPLELRILLQLHILKKWKNTNRTRNRWRLRFGPTMLYQTVWVKRTQQKPKRGFCGFPESLKKRGKCFSKCFSGSGHRLHEVSQPRATAQCGTPTCMTFMITGAYRCYYIEPNSVRMCESVCMPQRTMTQGLTLSARPSG